MSRPIPIRSVVTLLTLLLAVATVVWQPAVARAGPAPVQMLQDAFDAMSDSDFDEARKILGELILSYPGTPEAIRAEHELAVLNSRQDYGGGGLDAVALFGPRSREPQLRRSFALDVGDRVFFAVNSAAIGGRARVLIESQALWLKQRPELKVTVIGRADDDLDSDKSVLLSSKRAEAVRERLIASGIPSARISIEARGTSDPIATCATPLCRAENRHAETWIGELRGIGALGEGAARGSDSVNDLGSRGNVALPR